MRADESGGASHQNGFVGHGRWILGNCIRFSRAALSGSTFGESSYDDTPDQRRDDKKKPTSGTPFGARGLISAGTRAWLLLRRGSRLAADVRGRTLVLMEEHVCAHASQDQKHDDCREYPHRALLTLVALYVTRLSGLFFVSHCFLAWIE
jgi:hypothetical protein